MIHQLVFWDVNTDAALLGFLQSPTVRVNAFLFHDLGAVSFQYYLYRVNFKICYFCVFYLQI